MSPYNYDPPVHKVDDKDIAQVLPDMVGVWNSPVCLEGSPGRCHPQRRKAKAYPGKLQSYCPHTTPRQSVRETREKQVSMRNEEYSVCQVGFQKGRGCMEHVVRLSEHVKKALTAGLTNVATFFDTTRQAPRQNASPGYH